MSDKQVMSDERRATSNSRAGPHPMRVLLNRAVPRLTTVNLPGRGCWPRQLVARRSSLVAAALLLACAGPRAQQTDPPAPSLLTQPLHARWREQAPAVYRAAFETSRGRFVIEVHRDWGPIGADHFYNLVRNGYYNDTRFHRVLPNYIVQWGLHGNPDINRIWRARKIMDDAGPQKQSNTRGTIGYAMTGPNDRATQVYINLADNSRNDGQGLNPFGRIIEGMAVVDSLYNGYGPNSGNGVRQGQQGPIEEGGNAYLDREYPKLDRTLRAHIL